MPSLMTTVLRTLSSLVPSGTDSYDKSLASIGKSHTKFSMRVDSKLHAAPALKDQCLHEVKMADNTTLQLRLLQYSGDFANVSKLAIWLFGQDNRVKKEWAVDLPEDTSDASSHAFVIIDVVKLWEKMRSRDVCAMLDFLQQEYDQEKTWGGVVALLHSEGWKEAEGED